MGTRWRCLRDCRITYGESMTIYGSLGSRTHAVSGGLALLAMVLSGCGATPSTIIPPEVGPAVDAAPNAGGFVSKSSEAGDELLGIASWYGAWHQGKRTASGARFNRKALTAAHKTLPLGTKVLVTNLENQRSIVLTINDRGPYMPGRVIDVTERAAKSLGFHEDGLARVRIRVLPT
jgi:peptidoglycan lytic transglycosylase